MPNIYIIAGCNGAGWYIYNNSGSGYKLVAKCIDKEKEIFTFETYHLLFRNEKE